MFFFELIIWDEIPVGISSQMPEAGASGYKYILCK
jgi:hypothetical protein